MTEAKDKLKILVITRSYPPHTGGMERLHWELIQELSTYPGLEVNTVARSTTDILSLAAARRASALFSISALPRALTAAAHADVIHITDPVLSLIGWCIKKWYHKPVTVTVHGLDIVYPNRAYQLYLKAFFRNFDAYFPISKYVNDVLVKQNINKNRVVINSGIHDRFYTPTLSRNDLANFLQTKGYELKANSTTLLTVGRLVTRKGHKWFIENVLPSLPPSYIYITAGEGSEQNNIQKAAASCGITQRVFQLGRVSEEALKILYNTADIFIQPNIRTVDDVEGFGLVLLEAALCKRPVYAANIDGIPDAIHDGKNGILIESGNASAWIHSLRQTLENPAGCRRLGEQARIYTLANFSWKKAAQHYLEAFKKVAVR